MLVVQRIGESDRCCRRLRRGRAVPGACRQNDQRHQHQVHDSQPGVHRPPADLDQDRGEPRNHHQLAHADAGHRNRVGQPGTLRKPPVDDDADRRQRGDAVTDREHAAVQNERLPWFVNVSHEPDADRAQGQAPTQHQARAVEIRQTPGGEHARGRNGEEQGD